MLRSSGDHAKAVTVDIGAALWGGILGAIAVAVVWAAIRALRLTRLDLLRFEGGFVGHDRTGMAYIYGAIVQLIGGMLAALVYRLVFLNIDSATYVGWGALVGLGHGVLVALAFPLLGLVNRSVRAGAMPRPGPGGFAYGRLTPPALVAVHVLFGIWVGLTLVR